MFKLLLLLSLLTLAIAMGNPQYGRPGGHMPHNQQPVINVYKYVLQ